MRTALPAAGVRRFARLLGIAALIAAASCASAGAASASLATPDPSPAETVTAGSIGLRLLDQPADTRADPRARLYIVDHLAPGTVIERRIEVSNTTASTLHAVLYPAAAGIANATFVGAEGHTPNDLSTWMSVTPGSVDIPSGGTAIAMVTISVPQDAAPGEQYAVAWAEARSTLAGDGVIEVSRVGIRVYLSVGPGGPPPADFTIESLTASRTQSGQPFVSASVHNTGGRALDISGTLQLTDGPGGLSAGPFTVILGTTLGIGQTESVAVALSDQVPAGPWDAQITLSSGLVERSASATLTFPDEGIADSVSPSGAGPSSWRIFAAGLGVLLVALSILAVLTSRRRLRKPTPRLA